MKQNGLRAFQRSDFTAAIKEWSNLDLKAEPSAGRALAEAHFRRALNTADLLQSTADLTRAAELAPTEGRFWYHLGLTHHRAGRLDEARTAYARAAATGFARRPLGFARGLVEIECDPRVDGARLTAVCGDEATTLIPIAALLRGDPQAVLSAGAGSWIERLRGQARGDAVTALWRGLAFLATGQVAQAAETLGAATNSTLPGGAEAVRIFYRGLALVASGDRPGAQAQWAKLSERDRFPRLSAAVTSAYTSQVRTDLEAGRWGDVVKVTDAAFALTGPSQQQPALLDRGHRGPQPAGERGCCAGRLGRGDSSLAASGGSAGACASPWAARTDPPQSCHRV